MSYPDVGTLLMRLAAAMPDTWVPYLSSPSRGSYADNDVHHMLYVSPSGGPTTEFALHVADSVKDSGPRIARLADRAARATGTPVVVFIDFANRAFRESCAALDVGYVDLTGWVSLRSDAPALLVRTQGSSSSGRASTPSAMNRLDGPGASRVVRALAGVRPPIGVRELATLAAVSPGTAAKVLPTLASHGAVERTTSGAVSAVDLRLLLERWTQDYDFTTSNREVLWLLAARGVADLPDRISHLRVPALSTASVAARSALPTGTVSTIPLRLSAWYCVDPASLAEELGLRSVERAAANVVLARPRDISILTGDPAPGSAVDWFQAVADLETLGGRFADEGDQLLTEVEVTRVAGGAVP